MPHRFLPLKRFLRRTALILAIVFLLPAVLPTLETNAVTPTEAWPAAQLQQVATGFSQPVFVTHAGDASGRLFVVERLGKIRIVENGQIKPTAFLDIGPLLTSAGSEQGLLGLAFHPNYATPSHPMRGYFYVAYTAAGAGTKNTVARYRVKSDNPDQADPASARKLLEIDDFASNHNGGMLAFGPDGFLYVATGDGGSGGDPQNNGQRLDALLGKLLRLDVHSDSPETQPAPYYAIPSTNPFASGANGAKREIWAKGLRNPWRFSFDRQTGDLYIGDVGQGAREEISLQPHPNRPPAGDAAAGANYGWNAVEGSSCYVAGCNLSLYIPPIHDYPHASGDCSVTGGYVYRGSAVPPLQGRYLFGDYCSGRLWTLRETAPFSGSWVLSQPLDTPYNISSFGEDQAGELYLTHLGGTLFRFVGTTAPTSTPTPTAAAATATRTPTVAPATATPTSTAAPATATPTSTAAAATATPTPTTGSAPRPDLTITSFTANPTTADQPMRVMFGIQNLGSASTGPGDTFDIHIFGDLGRPATPGDNAYIGHIAVPRLAANASTTVIGDVFANTLTPGSHTLNAIVDGHDTELESNEGNNTANATVTVAAAAIARSLSLDGSAAYADAPHHPDLNVTGDWTIELWFKDETPGGFNHPIRHLLTKGRSGDTVDVPYFISLGTNQLRAGERTGSTNYAIRYDLAANGVNPTTWHHVAATMRASTRELILYLDGVEVARGVLPGHSTVGNTRGLSIGRDGNLGRYWQGKLDDVRVWNVVRTAADLATGRRSELTTAPTGLVGNWKFNEGTGANAGDSAGTPQNLTLRTSASWSPDVHP
ncbi:MAG: PQQ-dependent sugar dehydrogenase [Chloroflexi bacterium]|nr:PQQ-dependent sugar dehydrogenase [Chloroflexota bacterium]